MSQRFEIMFHQMIKSITKNKVQLKTQGIKSWRLMYDQSWYCDKYISNMTN